MLRPLLLAVLAAVLLTGATAAWAATRTLDATAELKTTKRDGLRATQRGDLDARPFGKGRLVLRTFIQKGKVNATFTAVIGNSTVKGTAFGTVEIKKRIKYSGTARITGGSGRFKKAKARSLKFTGDGPLNGRSTRVTLSGRISY
ncbi:hypothetical protein DSM112329_05066 [Paraconexibacter sp. AEG42_29]|uniref:Uncharacterized protein n=1 Tax=Paraconexibacter sp. AEG42_29 TaxID=2997339 RepID=A0AAU7B2L5_9ACTN